MVFLLGIIFVIVLANSCKKTSSFDEQGNLLVGSEFNAANLKRCFYKTFENSPEAVQLVITDKKYPVWKNGIYYKFSNYEVFEFPLIKNKKEFHIPSNLPQGDRKRIIEDSLDRIRFIKNMEGKITVIEVNYVTDIRYLKNKNYDISNTAMGKENSDFTGRMISKKIEWRTSY